MPAHHSPAIHAERLDLVLLTRDFIARRLAGQPTPDLGFADPAGFLAGVDDVLQLRLAQLDEDPAVGPWLMRAIVLHESRIAVGFIGFHAAPDERGMVEIGYELLPAFRRRGYASEAVAALLAWAAHHGARIARACVAPANVASLALVARHQFVQVGEQLDEVGGRELVLERPLA